MVSMSDVGFLARLRVKLGVKRVTNKCGKGAILLVVVASEERYYEYALNVS